MIKYKFKPLFTIRERYNGLSVGEAIYFSASFFTAMDKPVYVSFFFDTENKAVAVETHEEKGHGRHKLTAKGETVFSCAAASCGNQQLKGLMPKGRYIFVEKQDNKFICVKE
jgi:hypothetical protein